MSVQSDNEFGYKYYSFYPANDKDYIQITLILVNCSVRDFELKLRKDKRHSLSHLLGLGKTTAKQQDAQEEGPGA